MTSLINGNEVTGAEADMWMTSLAFIKNPTKDMLLELKVDNCQIKPFEYYNKKLFIENNNI